MATNFIPEENTLYSICFESSSWVKLYSSAENSIYSAVTESTSSQDFADEDLWQFFKVAENSYTIANYKYGTLWKLETDDGYDCVTLGNLQQETPVITPILTNSVGGNDWVQLVVSTVDMSGLVEVDSTGGSPNFMKVKTTSGFSFVITAIKDNPSSSTLAEINQGLEVEEPTFVNGKAPQLYPAETTIMNEVYVPYFMVNDPTMTSMADRIQQTPYYILRQYGQYEMAAEYKNGGTGTVTFVETWEYGWSATVSANISAQLGFELGGSIEANQIVLKETIQTSIKLNFGIEIGASASVSGTYSKQIRAEALENTTIAIYGITAKFELYQGNGTSAIASPNVPMKTNRRYVSISETDPNTES